MSLSNRGLINFGSGLIIDLRVHPTLEIRFIPIETDCLADGPRCQLQVILKLIVMRLVTGVFIIVDRSAYGNSNEWGVYGSATTLTQRTVFGYPSSRESQPDSSIR